MSDDKADNKTAPSPADGFMAKRGRAISVRSRFSGKSGTCYPDDLHVWIEGPGVAGWYRRDALIKNFIIIEEIDEPGEKPAP